MYCSVYNILQRAPLGLNWSDIQDLVSQCATHYQHQLTPRKLIKIKFSLLLLSLQYFTKITLENFINLTTVLQTHLNCLYAHIEILQQAATKDFISSVIIAFIFFWSGLGDWSGREILHLVLVFSCTSWLGTKFKLEILLFSLESNSNFRVEQR